MSFTASHVLPFDREFVWDWHTRKGAAARLSPPFFPMHPVKEAKRLSDGTTTYSLPAGLRWVSRHDLSAYRRGHRFSEVCVSSPIRSIADWRHTHSFADVEGGTTIFTPAPPAARSKVFWLTVNISCWAIYRSCPA